MSVQSLLNKVPEGARVEFQSTMRGDSVFLALKEVGCYRWTRAEQVQVLRHYDWTAERIATAYRAVFSKEEQAQLYEPLVGFGANLIPYVDPFEFTPKATKGPSGSYGPYVDMVKEEVEKRLIEKSTGQKNPSEEDIAFDANYGPLTQEFFPMDLWAHFCQRAQEHNERAGPDALKYNMENMAKVGALMQKMQPHKFSHFARNCFPPLTALDKGVRDRAADQGRDFDAPFVSSCGQLVQDPRQVINWFFTEHAIDCTESVETMALKWSKIKPHELAKAVAALRRCYGDEITEEECKIFFTREGQVAFFCKYQLLNNYLVRDIFEKVNSSKTIFNMGLGSAGFRTNVYLDMFAKARAMLVGTQECKNPIFAEGMEGIGFLPTAQQVSSDGSKVFLHGDFFEPDYDVVNVTVLNRLGQVDREGRAMGVLGTRKRTGIKVFAGSCHGSAKDPSDIIRQVAALKAKFEELQLEDPDLVFVLFVDANPNSKEEEEAFLKAIDQMGFIETDNVRTKLTTRAVTVMHEKAYETKDGRKDFILVPKWQALSHTSVAFARETLTMPLPNLKNPSDHGAVGAVIYPMRA